MGLVDKVGYDARGRDLTVSTEIIHTDGSPATVVECGELMRYVIDDSGKQVADTGGFVGEWRKFLRDPQPYLIGEKAMVPRKNTNRRYSKMSPEQVEASRERFRKVGLPIKCQGCSTDYRTVLDACPKCAKPRLTPHEA